MSCHICVSRLGTEIVKCKLCCDGEHQDFCIECAQVYDQYRASRGADLSKLHLLTVRRAEAACEHRIDRTSGTFQCTECGKDCTDEFAGRGEL